MIKGHRNTGWFATGFVLLVASCSSSSTNAPSYQVESVVQDLTVDPDGLTTVVTFDVDPGPLTTSNFSADGGQTAVAVSSVGATYTINWDARVTPTHMLQVVGLTSVASTARAVTTSDASSATFAVSGTQDTSDALLGGDTMIVSFSGPRVLPMAVEDSTNWTLTVSGQALDLAGSTITFVPSTQTASFALGSQANLHASFTLTAAGITSVADVAVAASAVSGTATGDVTAPTTPTIEQNLTADALGRVVDVTFNEPMDPVFATALGNFSVNDHAGSSAITLVTGVTQPAANVLQLTFSAPVVPTLDTLDLVTVMDAHGNTYSGTEAIGNSGALANTYSSVTARTAEGLMNDYILVVTDQAFDPDLAVDPSLWTLTIAGSSVTMADQTLTYALAARELLIELDADMDNADAVVITALAGQTDVDGQAFTGAPAFGVSASGDAAAPSVATVVQNRSGDPSGQSVDVTFSEAVDPTSATTPANYSFTGGTVVVGTPTLLPGGMIVRVPTDTILTPGDYTMTPAAAIEDVAGNVIGGTPSAVAITSTDSTSPAASTVAGDAIEGAANDTITVVFNDDMVASEVESVGNWSAESPLGSSFDLAGGVVVYDVGTRTATLTLPGAEQNFKGGDDVEVSFTTMRDIGGNVVGATAKSGSIAAETTLPAIQSIWFDSATTNQVVLYFTEPCDLMTTAELFNASTNSTGTRFPVRFELGAGGVVRGYPNSSTVLDGGLGVRLNYPFTINYATSDPTNDIIDVAGVTDLAGNVLFSTVAGALSEKNTGAPALDGSSALTIVSGESNDSFVVDFTERMNAWGLFNASNYSLETTIGANAVDLSSASISWDGAQIVTVELDTLVGPNLQDGVDYELTVNVDGSDPLRTAQGVPIAAPATDSNETASGDAAVPTVSASNVHIDVNDDRRLLIVFDEAISAVVDDDPALVTYNGVAASSVELLNPRVVRATWASSLTDGLTLQIMAAAVNDLAGNVAAGNVSVVETTDASPPLLSGFSANSVANAGGDSIQIQFDEQVDLLSALDAGNYAINNGSTLDLSGAQFVYNSTSRSVTIWLPSGIEIDTTAALTLDVTTLSDVSGNAIGGPINNFGGTISGDSLDPAFDAAFVNIALDASGAVVDVLFSEDVDSAYAAAAGNWTTSGATTVNSVTTISARHARLTLSAALGASETLSLDGITDLAQNSANPTAIDPIE
jgi:hypothetical protein